MMALSRKQVRHVTALWGAARVGLGLIALATPGAAAAVWVGPSARGSVGTVLGRALGGRDASIGAGTLASAMTGSPLLPWVLAGAAADAVDAVTTVIARPALPRGRRDLVIAASGGSVLLAALLTSNLRSWNPGHEQPLSGARRDRE